MLPRPELRQTFDESIALHALSRIAEGAGRVLEWRRRFDRYRRVDAQKHLPRLKTCTRCGAIRSSPGYDEVAEAQATAAHFDCENTVVDVTDADVRGTLYATFAGDLRSALRRRSEHLDDSRAAARDVKGVLSGARRR